MSWSTRIFDDLADDKEPKSRSINKVTYRKTRIEAPPSIKPEKIERERENGLTDLDERGVPRIDVVRGLSIIAGLSAGGGGGDVLAAGVDYLADVHSRRDRNDRLSVRSLPLPSPRGLEIGPGNWIELSRLKNTNQRKPPIGIVSEHRKSSKDRRPFTEPTRRGSDDGEEFKMYYYYYYYLSVDPLGGIKPSSSNHRLMRHDAVHGRLGRERHPGSAPDVRAPPLLLLLLRPPPPRPLPLPVRRRPHGGHGRRVGLRGRSRRAAEPAEGRRREPLLPGRRRRARLGRRRRRRGSYQGVPVGRGVGPGRGGGGGPEQEPPETAAVGGRH
ncbi:hypothetical protein BHE74_00019530 [Ensete ventricosum]|nr:hypothetical protein BHE74_00019530 [Ensete ventricosum]